MVACDDDFACTTQHVCIMWHFYVWTARGYVIIENKHEAIIAGSIHFNNEILMGVCTTEGKLVHGTGDDQYSSILYCLAKILLTSPEEK